MAHVVYIAYLLECADGTLYAGWTTDIVRRLEEHNGSKKGAKYTKPRRPVVLKYSENFKTKEEAQRREYALKQLTRSEKLQLFAAILTP
ncbi:GIY-YIG nuclease family protein [Patescibacteria group bacterium]|nr:GIY-YIG nuclease family protein [Patescibacteria group bacterium]